MQTLPLLALAGLLCLAVASDQDSGTTKPFQQKNTEYHFTYNAQIASGLIAGSEEDAADPQQKAVTRIQCQASIQFASERHGQLRLHQCRVGQQNAQMTEPEEVQPMGAFEQKNIPSEKLQQLHQPCLFKIVDGTIEGVQFQQDEQIWSKNMKRAVLNMIQMNLKRNNAQGLRSTDDQGDDDADQGSQKQAQQIKLGKTFTIPEITLEGACQTTYTINKADQSSSSAQLYNVTKTINFKKCQKIADVAHGYQTQQQQSHCGQCQQYWAQQQGGSGKQDGQSPQTQWQQQQQAWQQNSEQHPCAQCDPKEVKEQELDRSTVIRCQIQGQPTQKYALERCELLSQYVYRNAKSENGKYGSAMQTVVAATLQARGAQEASGAQQQIPSMSSSKEESLMFSNELEVDVKRFFMFGDEEFSQSSRDRNSPFHQVPNVQQAEQALRKLVQAMQEDKQQKGIDAQAPQQLQRLVEMLRMSTQPELKRIEQQAVSANGGNTQQQKQQTKQIMIDALAMCGTRNCVAELAQRIKNTQETSQTKAVQALLSLNQLPAPSDAIVKQIEQLCKSEQVHRQKAVKQACWLTFGALVHELCQHKTLKNAQQCATTFGAKCSQSGFTQQDQCPMDKRQQYKEAMLSVYQNSECIYDKVLGLSSLGNAGLDNSVGDLERIIKNPAEPRVVRVKAIDALRRLRTQQARKIQRILLPLFQNTREHPQVRTAAFAIIMYTEPEPQVVDQLMFTISMEPNKQVQSFAYRTMKMMARSKSQNARQIAKHIKSALKVANVDEQQLRASGKWQMPLYSAERQEGVFVTLATTISQRSALPVYAHAQLDTQANDQFQMDQVKLYMMQQEAEQWYHQVAGQYAKQFRQTTRGQRQNWQQQNQKSLNDIYQALGIKSRRSYSSQQDNNIEFGQYTAQNSQPFAMLCIRSRDVDQGILALDEHIMSEQTRQMLNGQQKPSLAHLLGMHKNAPGIQLNGAMATSLQEKEAKIPTSAGVPLRVLNSVPVLVQIEGQTAANTQSQGFQLDINAKASACLAHIQKMESWTPFCASGVQSMRALTINAPLQGELNANPGQGISIKVKLPQQKTQLAAVHTLPITYTATVDPRTELIREPKQIRAIHNPKLERQQHEVSSIHSTSNKLGMPLHIQGHYHWPAQPTDYKQFVQLLMATENAVRVSYQPSPESPREVIFSASGAHFQKSSQFEKPDDQLRNFYAQKFDSPYACGQDQCSEGDCDQCSEFEQYQQQDVQEMYSQQQRQQQLQQFINAYSSNSGSNQYKHSLKLIAQTKGGKRDVKAQADIDGQCDAHLKYCKMQLKADRTQIGTDGQQWTLQAHAQLVMPQPASSAAHLQQQQQQQQQQFFCQAQAQWGPQGQQKQQVTVRVQGMQAYSAQVRNILQQQQSNKQLISTEQLRNFQRRSAFLNKFELQADYQLKAPAQNAINRALELLKSAYLWNTYSQLTGYGAQQKGQVSASIVIDPITQKHANVTIRTPSQQVRLQQIELPTSVRPFPLIRQQSAQQTHSLAQLFQRASVSGRAQCKVDGRSVDTFDDSEFRAPLSSNCYTVLAKDCGSEEPQFVVLMKKQSNQQGRSGQNAQKKLKVITPQEEIECEPKQQNGQQLSCKVNGQQVNGNQQQEDSVQYNNAQQSDVTIQAEGIAVRFNGRKAWLKVSSEYKNAQCGLCGHYDDSDDQQDEWRMANGQIASKLVDFQRSYTLKDPEQCSEQQLNSFYNEQYNDADEQSDSYFKQYKDDDEDSDEDNDGEDDEQDQDWQKEQFDGQFDSSEEEDNDDDDSSSYDVQDIFGIGNNGNSKQCCCCCEDDDEQCQANCKSTRQCRKQCARNQCANGNQQRHNNQQQHKQCCCCCDLDDDQCTQQCEQSGRCARQCTEGQCQRGQQQQVSPVWKTMVQEQHHAVCFSAQPVKQCPRGTVEEDNDDDDQEDDQQQETKKVRFVCLERADPETRRLLNQLRNGKRVVQVSSKQQGTSFTEKVREPQQCQRRRY